MKARKIAPEAGSVAAQYSGCHWTPNAKADASFTRTASIVPSGACAFDREPWAELADHLAMHRVDLYAARAEQRGELAVRLEIHLMRELEALVVRHADRRAMVEAAGALLRLGDERAAERDVQLLEAAADRKERHAALERKRDQRERRRVAIKIVRLVPLRRLLSVARRMHVRARAGQEHAVDAREHRLKVERIAKARQEQRRAAGQRDGAQVGLDRGMPDIAVG